MNTVGAEESFKFFRFQIFCLDFPFFVFERKRVGPVEYDSLEIN